MTPAGAGAASSRATPRSPAQPVLLPRKIITPTLMLYGVNDPFRNPAATEFFTALATPDRTFTVLPDSDRAAHDENSRLAWMHAILSFLQQPRARS